MSPWVLPTSRASTTSSRGHPERIASASIYTTSRKKQFGEPLIENPTYDLISAQVSRDGKHVIRHCYRAHVRVCSFSDAQDRCAHEGYP